MNIICHRGQWEKKVHQNSLKACLKGIEGHQGIEIDLKNLNGDIVLSHDPLKMNQKAIKLETLFKKCPKTFFALNIKEDGLAPTLKKLLKKYKIKNYMCFDLSRPEELNYQALKLAVFKRFGDKDPKPANLESGLVVDIFDQACLPDIFRTLKRSSSGPLFFISPELHGQPELAFWNKLKDLSQKTSQKLYLCTDFPDEALIFFQYPPKRA